MIKAHDLICEPNLMSSFNVYKSKSKPRLVVINESFFTCAQRGNYFYGSLEKNITQSTLLIYKDTKYDFFSYLSFIFYFFQLHAYTNIVLFIHQYFVKGILS